MQKNRVAHGIAIACLCLKCVDYRGDGKTATSNLRYLAAGATSHPRPPSCERKRSRLWAAEQKLLISRPLHNVYHNRDNVGWHSYLYAPSQMSDEQLLFRDLRPPTSFTGTKSAIVDETTFRRNFRMLTNGLFDGVNWRNLLVAGGSMLACLTHDFQV